MKLFNHNISFGLLFIELVEDEFDQGFIAVFEDFQKSLDELKTKKSLRPVKFLYKFLFCGINAQNEIDGKKKISINDARNIFEAYGLNHKDTSVMIQEMAQSIKVVFGESEEPAKKSPAKKKKKK